jgi:hypothetical protein
VQWRTAIREVARVVAMPAAVPPAVDSEETVCSACRARAEIEAHRRADFVRTLDAKLEEHYAAEIADFENEWREEIGEAFLLCAEPDPTGERLEEALEVRRAGLRVTIRDELEENFDERLDGEIEKELWAEALERAEEELNDVLGEVGLELEIAWPENSAALPTAVIRRIDE